MAGRQYSAGSYRYGFGGKENDPEDGWQDYGQRMYDPKLGRFFSVDPFVRTFSYFTPYQYAANDVIRCVDIDGAESGVTIWSPSVKGEVKAALENEDYASAMKWLNYGRAHSWVDNSGKPSTFYQNLANKLGVTYEIPTDKSVTDEVLENTSPYLLSHYGDQSKGGGWIRVQFYNIKVDGFETVGYLPLSKINDDGKLKMFSIKSDEFWDIEPIFRASEWKQEMESRVTDLILDKIKGLFMPMDVDDPTSLGTRKMEMAIKGRLRAAGNNSCILVPEFDMHDNVVKVHSYTYKVDDSGSESFEQHTIELPEMKSTSEPEIH